MTEVKAQDMLLVHMVWEEQASSILLDVYERFEKQIESEFFDIIPCWCSCKELPGRSQSSFHVY